MSEYAKCIHSETLEIRLVKLNNTVKRMLISGSIAWVKRKRGELTQTADTLYVDSQEIWEKLLPYFDHTAEINRRQHGAKWQNEK